MCLQFIVQEFSGIERKIKNNEYEQFADFERELKLFMKYFLENGPQIANRQQTLLEYMFKTVKDVTPSINKIIIFKQFFLKVCKLLRQETQK